MSTNGTNNHSATDTERDEVHHTDASPATLSETSPVSTFGTLLCLPAGSASTKVPNVQLGLFGEIAPFVLPSSADPIEVGPAEGICPDCHSPVYPSPLSDPAQGWNLYPCCHFECGCCFEVGTHICDRCEKIEDGCCDCAKCARCGESYDSGDECGTCGYCPDCDECYSCASCGAKDQYGDYVCGECGMGDSSLCGCCDCYAQSVGNLNFVENGWNAPIPAGDACARFREDFGQHVDPRQAMSDFYLLDYIVAVLPTSTMGARMHRVAYLDPDGAEYGDRVRVVQKQDDLSQYDVNEPLAQVRAIGTTHPLARQAATLQDHIVRVCDDAFREYGFMAIGGEMRHEYGMRSVFPTHGRENTWGWVSAMGEKYGRVPMLEDFLRLCQEGGWDGGYGGKAWADCTKIVLMREKGDLDAKTFVDRCFALVHNSGCFIDKAAWGPSSYYPEKYHFVTIGNAHAADSIDFAVLVRNASDDAKGLLRALLAEKSAMPDSDRANLAYALGVNEDGTEREMSEFTAYYQDEPVQATSCSCDLCVPVAPKKADMGIPNGSPASPYSVWYENIEATVPGDPNGHLCLKQAPSGGYVCTGPEGHLYAHMAYAGSMACPIAPWTDKPVNSDKAPKVTYNMAYGMICDEINKTSHSLASIGIDAIGDMALKLVQAVKNGASASLEALLLVEEQIAKKAA